MSLLATGEAVVSQPLQLTLAEALRLAHSQGRAITTQREDLALEQQSLAKVRGDYGPIPSASLGATWNDIGTQQRLGETRTGQAAISQSLPGGGTATVTGTVASNQSQGTGAESTAGTAKVEVAQPLLRGAGILPWRENLTRAERALIYQQRGFASFREDLTIQTATSFWGLQRQQAAVAAARSSLDRARFTFDQSQALMSVGKTTANDVFRAETNLLQARQAVVDEEATLATQADNLKLELVIDPRRLLIIDQTPPPLDLLPVDAAEALTTALAKRRDLATAKDAVEDSNRAFTLARRDLLPRLGASGSWLWAGGLEDTHGGWEQPPAWRVAVDLEIPLDQRSERLALEQARVNHLRAQRNEAEHRERVVVQVRDSIRRLRSAEASLSIQDRNQEQTRRRAEKAAIDFKSGKIGNRDLVEAQNEVRAAEDAHYAALVSYRIAELSLRRDTGTLVVLDDGGWDPTPPPYAARKATP